MSKSSSFFLALVVSVATLALVPGCSKQAKLERHLSRGNEYFQAKKYREAEIEYKNVLRIQPNTIAMRNLGMIYFEQGRLPHALVVLQTVKGMAADDLEVRLKLGIAYLLNWKLKEAREEANFVLSKQPTNDDALVLLGDAAVGTNEIWEAFKQLESLRPQAGNRSGFHTALGTLQVRQNDLDKAEASFRQAIALDGKSSAAHVGLGNVLLLQDDMKRAEEAFKTAATLSPPSPRSVNYAGFLIKVGNIEGAKKWLEEITKNAPDYMPAALRLAELAMAEKKYDECNSMLQKILAQDNINFDALMLSGRLRLLQGQATNAIAEFERLNSIYPRVPRVLHQLAVAHLLNKDSAKAFNYLSQTLAANPEFPDAVRLLAELNIQKGDPAAAVASLTQFMQKRTNNMEQAYLLLAKAYRAQNKLDEAAAIYRRLMTADPKDVQLPFFLGMTCLQQNKKAEARQAFEKAHALEPDLLGPLEQLVNLDLEEKQLGAAFQRVNPLVEKNPKVAVLHALLAKVYSAQGNLLQAESALLKAIELDPDYAIAQSMLTQFYLASKQPEKALQTLQELASKTPKAPGPLLQMGTIHYVMKNYAGARDAYEKALELNPKSTLALNNLASLYLEHLPQPDRAYELARRASELAPEDTEIADTFGWALFKRGDYTRALPLLRASAGKLQDNPDVLYHLGATHYMLGQEEPARAAFQKALQLNKDFSGRADVQRRLAVLALDPAAGGPNVVSDLEKRLAEQPGDSIVLARLATAYERAGAGSKAIGTYEQAIKQNAKSIPALLGLIRLHSGQRETSKALEYAKTARALAPDDPQIAHTLGRLTYQQGDHKYALSLLQESAARLPRAPEVLYDLAWAFLANGRVADALATMQAAVQAVQTFPQLDAARQFVSVVTLLEQPERAKASSVQVQQILQADPSYLPALAVSGLVQEQQGNAKAAQQVYERILDRFPLFTPANARLAILFAGPLQDYPKAHEHGLKARTAFPEDSEVAKAVGIAAYKRAEYPRAVQLLKETATKRTNDAEVFFYAGMAHFQLKQKPQCKEALTRALAIGGNASFVEEAKRTLAQLQ